MIVTSVFEIFDLLNAKKMNLLLLNAASGSKLEQALEKLVDFGMDAGNGYNLSPF